MDPGYNPENEEVRIYVADEDSPAVPDEMGADNPEDEEARINGADEDSPASPTYSPASPDEMDMDPGADNRENEEVRIYVADEDSPDSPTYSPASPDQMDMDQGADHPEIEEARAYAANEYSPASPRYLLDEYSPASPLYAPTWTTYYVSPSPDEMGADNPENEEPRIYEADEDSPASPTYSPASPDEMGSPIHPLIGFGRAEGWRLPPHLPNSEDQPPTPAYYPSDDESEPHPLLANLDEDRAQLEREINEDNATLTEFRTETILELPQVGTSSAVRTFDMNLPTEHSYLGNDLQQLRGRTIFENNQILSLNVLPSDVIICPGYTLPLTYSRDFSLIREIIDKDRTFGLCFVMDSERKKYSKLGVTLEIYEFLETPDEIKIKARGRQRFRVLNRIENQKSLYKVQILSDIQLPPILKNIQLSSLNRHRKFVTDILTFNENAKFRKWDASQTQLPIWIYNSFDEQLCVHEIRELLKNFIEFLPLDSMQLSYWVIQNYILTRQERMDVLTYNCSIERLRVLLELIQIPRHICCANCKLRFAGQSQLFPMSKDGLQNNFVNPGRVVHETLTLLNARNIELVGRSETMYSWFPGYAWIIAQCKKCNSHVGWQFSAVKPDLRPARFFGLTRSSVTIVAPKGYKISQIRPME